MATRRLTSDHAEDIGGYAVEPGAEFDDRDADPAVIERLESEGKLAEVESESPTKKGKS